MDTAAISLIIIGIIFGYIIFYYIVKAAVRNGIIEAKGKIALQEGNNKDGTQA